MGWTLLFFFAHFPPFFFRHFLKRSYLETCEAFDRHRSSPA